MWSTLFHELCKTPNGKHSDVQASEPVGRSLRN
jgi:hypothetical protein